MTSYDDLMRQQPGLRGEEQDELRAPAERPDARARRARIARVATLQRRITTARYRLQSAAERAPLGPLTRALATPDTADLAQIEATLKTLGC